MTAKSRHARSAELYQRALRSVPQGTHSSSRKDSPHPFYFRRGEGAWIWDVDDNRLVDCVLGNGALVFGHASPIVRQAIEEAMADGLESGLETELSVEVSELFLRLVPTADQVRFATTGTEAVMHALHMARAATGMADVAKIEAAYHGWYDLVYVSTWPDLTKAGSAENPASLPGAGGLKPDAVGSTLVIPFNDAAAAVRLLEVNADRLAALLVEPVLIDVGYIPPEPGYLDALREATARLGIVLIFDELLTGFRVAVGGAQERYGVRPDLSIWGKALAGGQILSAVAGGADLMAQSAGAAGFVGTFNGHQWSLAAARASLTALADGALIRQLEEGTRSLAERFDAAARRAGIGAKFHGGGGHFQCYFADEPVRDYRSAARADARRYARFRAGMLERGVLLVPGYTGHNAISTAHGPDILELVANAMEAALGEVAAREGSTA